MDDPRPDTPRPTWSRPMTLAVVGVGALAAWTVVLPESVRPWNFAALGAVSMFAAARLGFRAALVVLTVVLGVKELGVYLAHDLEPYPLTWFYLTGYAAIGWAALRYTKSPFRIGGAALGASAAFFLVSNFVSWLEQALPYGYSLAGLMNCYESAVPFYRTTLLGDVFYTGVLFGLHAALSRAFFPAEQAVAVLPVLDAEDGP